MPLFRKQNTTLNSGQSSDFKIECDALKDSDIACIAYLISKQLQFSSVVGVPTGGIRLQNALMRYVTEDKSLPVLICDDVLTTGNSMEKKRTELAASSVTNTIGVVIFARGNRASWICAVFTMSLSFINCNRLFRTVCGCSKPVELIENSGGTSRCKLCGGDIIMK